ncbi:MAG: gamma-glutamyl-gamma-aminobutyrate hydrolase family protein [Chloroflexota bacterium]|nr:gamma-glutamyl-gamma-aminobutyrate hydrolase family protein [Chloroflexota bacterium]
MPATACSSSSSTAHRSRGDRPALAPIGHRPDTADVTRIVLTLGRSESERNKRARALYVASIARPSVDLIEVTASDAPPGRFDALYLSGGEDVHPGRYHEDRDPHSTPIDKDRDELELELLARALERDVPVLGVCRGFQVLNVFLGGSLEQHRTGHSPKYPPDGVSVGDDPTKADAIRHDVHVESRSLLAQACGETLRVNSSHHQVVTPERLATKNVRATVTYDGIVEALESTEHRWVVGVQWHPERTKQVDAAARGIFDAFVHAAEGVPAR